MKTSTLMSICAAAVLMVACGGGGGGNDVPVPVTDVVPDEASASAPGMANWLGQVASTAPEDKEALDVARFTPPQPDNTEPETLK